MRSSPVRWPTTSVSPGCRSHSFASPRSTTTSPGRAFDDVAPLDDLVAAPARADGVDRAAVREVALGEQLGVQALVAVGGGGEVGQRAHPLVDRRARLVVEARDHVGQPGAVGGALEARRQPVADRHARCRRRARRRRSPARTAASATRAPAGPRGRGSAWLSLPPSRRRTRSAIAVAPASCVTITTARPSSAPARRSRSTSAPASASRLPVGSSASSSDGSLTSARAIAKRCCSPPESWCGSDAGDVAQAEPVDQRAAARGRLGRGAAHAPGQQHVGLAGELGQQVEELEDEPDVAPAQRRELALGRARDVDAARSRCCPPRRGRARRARAAASTSRCRSGRARPRPRRARPRGRRRRAPAARRGPRRTS